MQTRDLVEELRRHYMSIVPGVSMFVPPAIQRLKAPWTLIRGAFFDITSAFHAACVRFALIAGRKADIPQGRVRASSGHCSHWPNETLWNIGPRLPDQSALTPANFTTLAHFSVSAARSLPNSAGEPASTLMPMSVNQHSLHILERIRLHSAGLLQQPAQ